MLIAHVIGGVIFFASFLLRTPQVSTRISLFFSTSKSHVSPVQSIEDVPFISSTSIDSPSSPNETVFFPSPVATDWVFFYFPFQYSHFDSRESTNRSTESTIWAGGQDKCFSSLERDEEESVLNPVSYFNILLLLVPPCAIFTVYLAYVSHSIGHLWA